MAQENMMHDTPAWRPFSGGVQCLTRQAGTRWVRGTRTRCIVIGAVAAHTIANAYGAEPSLSDLANLSLEQLTNIEVTSVSGRAERLSDAPGSIFVITAEDIRRSGATSLPEVLRLAPNLEVARINASQYAISARGFNNSVGNKLLVLIDGRIVYTPLFSGVFWDAQDTLLRDIERIEVISGPGATLWGANAVNGVINVITRRAPDTQGSLLLAGAGNRERGAAARYGGEVASSGHYRVYGQYFDHSHTEHADGSAVRDAWRRGQIGFRADWGSTSEGFAFQGDAYSAKLEQTRPGVDNELAGVNLIARWARQLANGSGIRLQAYYDHTDRDNPGSFREKLDIFDIQFQHSIGAIAPHNVLWGAGYRYARDRVDNTAALAFLPGHRSLNWANAFVQDEVALNKTVALTLGAKVESNDYTGAEFLPSARLAWRPYDNRLIWTAISRAVRAPSRLDRELFIPGTAPFQLAGGPNFRSEVSNVVEIGYRAQPSRSLSYSITAFHHVYDRLRSIEPAPGGGFVLGNEAEGTASGVEAWSSYRVTEAWRLSGGAVFLGQHLRLNAQSADPVGVSALGNDPRLTWSLRSALDLTNQHEFDVTVRHVSALPNPAVPTYTAVDARFAWRPRGDLELSLTFQNLFDPTHPEFGSPTTRSELDRSVFFNLLWRL